MSPDSAADERLRKGRAEIHDQRHLFERLAVDVNIILGGVPATLIVFAFKKIILKNKKFLTWVSLTIPSRIGKVFTYYFLTNGSPYHY